MKTTNLTRRYLRLRYLDQQEQIKDVVVKSDGTIRTLVPSGGVKNYGVQPNRTGDDFAVEKDVSIYFYDREVKCKTEHFM